jgi:hypothetical protein
VFTLFTTGFALLFVVPVVFIGSCTASIAFLWGLVGYLVLQRINGGETPVQPGAKVGDTLNELTGGRPRGLVDRANSDPQQERLAVDSSQDKKAPVWSEGGRGDNKTRSGSPRRRLHGQTNGTGYGGEVGEKGEESGAQGTEVATGHLRQGTRDHPETHMSTYDPTAERVVDWKTEFQQEGMTA